MSPRKIRDGPRLPRQERTPGAFRCISVFCQNSVSREKRPQGRIGFFAKDIKLNICHIRCFEIFSPDQKTSCVFRAESPGEAADWAANINAAIRESLAQGAALAGKSLGCGVSRLGWARVQHQDHVTSVSSDSSFDSGTSSGGGWVQALLALTDSHLLWWESVPTTPQMWSLPTRSLRLIQTRLVNHRSPIYQTEQYSICIRSE